MKPNPNCPEAVDARERLSAALVAMGDRDQAPACAGGTWWISEAAEERAAAAEACRGCPALEACARAGRYEPWGVWGGVDRSPSLGRPKTTTTPTTERTA